MRRLLLIVTAGALAVAGAAAAQRAPGPAPGFFDLPVPGGAASYEALDLLPEERGAALSLLARQLFSQGAANAQRVQARLQSVVGAPAPSGESDEASVAAPFSPDAWRDVLDPAHRDDLFAGIVSSREALLVAAGGVETDASIRDLLDHDRGLLRWILRTAPGAFVIAAPGLRLDAGRLDPPGDAAEDAAWEALAGERLARPAEMIRAVLSKDAGRLAWFLGTLGTIDPATLAALLPPVPAASRADRLRALYEGFRQSDPNWRIEEHPYLRATSDAWMVTTRVAVADGAVAAPGWQGLWRAVFDRDDLDRRDAEAAARETSATPFAWLLRQVVSMPPRERRDRYEMVRFAQGVFAGATEADAADVVMAIGGYRRYRGALLAVDRMGITHPRVFARVVEAARRVGQRGGRDERQALVAYQGALGIIERVRVSHAIDTATAESLVLSLADAVDTDRPIPASVAAWITGPLMAGLPRLKVPDRFTGRTAYESKILQAMAGPVDEPGRPSLEWEGLAYLVDLTAWEQERLTRIRDQIVSPGLDAALASGDPADLGNALMAVLYAFALGDPDGPALLGNDVATRHDFGFNAAAGSRRQYMSWLPPREVVGDGVPWHVEGALTGLDLGLARVALRRIADNEMPAAPSINLNDEITLGRATAAIDPRELADADRDEVVAAIARGRARIAEAVDGPGGPSLRAGTAAQVASRVDALAAEAGLTRAVRQTLPWLAAHDPGALPALFGLRDQLRLGHPALDRARLDRWGGFAEPLDARWRTAFPDAAPWDGLAGRAEGGVMGAITPDLTLRLAQETARLGLPARLIPALLQFATLDYWHDVDARFADDQPAIARQALALSSARVEDYVAALAGDGPLRPQ